jgi:uncharacterized membrane protein HdeD (DUF308 family)/predicted flap endonuclease-1-like 5' DNA nuclease
MILIEGIALIIIGIWLLQTPLSAITTIVFILGLYWIISGIFNFIRLFWDRRVWGWKIFTGIVGILAGYFVISYPLGSTAVIGATFIYFLAFIGIFVGIGNLIQAFTGAGWGTGILGVISIILGVLLLMNTGIATLSLPWTLGLMAIFGGILAIINAFRYRGMVNDLEDAADAARAKGVTAASTVDSAAKRTGAAAAGVGAGLAGAADKAWDSTADTAGDAADTVGDAASSAADAAGDVAAGAVDTVSDAADATGDMVADAWDATTDAAGDAADAVGDAADDAVDGAKRLFGIDVDLTPEEVADLGDAYADLPSEAQASIANMVNDLAHISPDQALELRQQGVTDLKSLLEMGATPAGRAALAKSLNEDPKTILTWVNFADLQRIKGIGVKYSYLLEQAGVDTVVELAARNPDNLYNKLVEVNQAGDYVDLLPSAAQVLDWCAQAKDLPRAINY